MINRLFPYLLGSLSALLLFLGADDRLSGRTMPAPAAVEMVLSTAVADPLAYTTADLTARLGMPPRVTTRPVANSYDPSGTDTVRTLDYPGLSLTLYEVTAPAKTILTQLVVTDPAYAAPSGLRVGMAYDEVVEILGTPTSRARTQYVYEATAARPADLTIRFEEGRAVALHWVVFFE